MNFFRMSIRHKIIIAFLLVIAAGTFLWVLFYYCQYTLQKKICLLEAKSDLLNTILEARRYEKNFFLYKKEEDLKKTIIYIDSAYNQLETILHKYGRFAYAKDLDSFKKKLSQYRTELSELMNLYKNGRLNTERLSRIDLDAKQALIRDLGRNITAHVEEMLNNEKIITKRLLKTMSNYHLIALIGIILILTIFVIFLMISVLRPLKLIEDAIHKIRMGDYQHIPHIKTGDEFESLAVSVNKMIKELDRRNQQLIQTEKMASLGTLTAGVAHELNNPLNNIYTSLQILLEELEEGDLEYQRSLLKETEKQVERARDIIKALLEFSRERIFELKETNLSKLISKTISLIKPEIPAEVKVNVKVPEDLVVKIDANKIQQVLINLLMNALLAMNGKGVLSIEADSIDESKFFIKVSDTGIGIPKENLSKIFDPFFTTWERSKGSGLGLSVSKGIIQKHGGTIKVESEVGKGTTFTIILPKGDWK